MRIAAFIFILVVFQPVFATAQEIEVDFQVRNFPDSTVYIGYHFGNQKYILDTLQVENESFTLSVKKPEVKPGLYFIYTPTYFFEFILEDTSFQIRSTFKEGYTSFEPTGSVENQLFKAFQLELGSLQKEQVDLQEALKQEAGDSVEIKKRLKEVDTQVDAFRENVLQTYPQSFMASFLKLMDNLDLPDYASIGDANQRKNLQYLYYKNHYFDLVDLEDPRLLRSPLLHNKVMTYFDQLVIHQPDSIIQELDWFFGEVERSPELFRYWLVTFFKHYAASEVMGMDAVMVHLMENYYLTDRVDWINEEYEKKLREEVAFIKPNLIGKTAPPLNVVDTLMQPFYLAQIESPYTLVFIYDPDCGHCKSTIKELEEVDMELANSGVKVLAVCTITDVERWKTFVAESNPQWIHVIDPGGTSYFRVSYNVRTTPKMYLLDAEKHIVAKQLNVNQFLDFIKRMK